MKYDVNKNGVIDSDERLKLCGEAGWSEKDCDQRLPKDLVVTAKYLYEISESTWQENVKEVLREPDSKPYSNEVTPMASYAWWKMWFSDDKSVIEDLFNFDGPISFLNGDIDTQTPGNRELELVQAKIHSFKIRPRAKVLRNTGHGFGNHGTYGPMTKENIQTISNEIKILLR